MTYKYIPTIQIIRNTGGVANYTLAIPFAIPTAEMVGYIPNMQPRVFDLSNYWTVDKIENRQLSNKIYLQTGVPINIDLPVEFLSKYTFVVKKVTPGCCGTMTKLAEYLVIFKLV
jgi:hypothetical protein